MCWNAVRLLACVSVSDIGCHMDVICAVWCCASPSANLVILRAMCSSLFYEDNSVGGIFSLTAGIKFKNS
jgi:hypothetical protein